MAPARPRTEVSDKRAVFFVHLPKTAGTSLARKMEEHFARQEIYPGYSIPELLSHDRDALQRYRLYRGHFSFDCMRLLEKNVLSVTILREPTARALSHFKHILKQKDHWLHRKADVHAASPEALLSNAHARRLLDNHQTRRLALPLSPESAHTPLPLLPPRRLDEAHLERAKAALLSIDVVGLVEDIDEVVDDLRKTPEFADADLTLPRLNTIADRGDSYDDVTPAMVEEISALNAFDAELYEYAQGLVAARRSGTGPSAKPLRPASRETHFRLTF